VSAVQNPNFVSYGGDFGDYDNTLIQVNAPFTMNGAKYGFYRMFYPGAAGSLVGKTVTCMGFGAYTHAQGGAGTLRTANLLVQNVPLPDAAHGDYMPHGYTLQTNGSDQNIWPGDSGGPCFYNNMIAGMNWAVDNCTTGVTDSFGNCCGYGTYNSGGTLYCNNAPDGGSGIIPFDAYSGLMWDFAYSKAWAYSTTGMPGAASVANDAQANAFSLGTLTGGAETTVGFSTAGATNDGSFSACTGLSEGGNVWLVLPFRPNRSSALIRPGHSLIPSCT
jgi:hypothetical protein